MRASLTGGEDDVLLLVDETVFLVLLVVLGEVDVGEELVELETEGEVPELSVTPPLLSVLLSAI